MADQGNNTRPSDPFEPFRAMRDSWLDSMAKSMVDAVNTDAYAQATGAMLEGYLAAAAPFREALEKSMTQALQQMSLPSRQEVAALAERFTHVEMRLDDMDAKLDEIRKMMRERAAPEPAGPEGPGKAAVESSAQVPKPQVAASAGSPQARRRIARKRGLRAAQR